MLAGAALLVARNRRWRRVSRHISIAILPFAAGMVVGWTASPLDHQTHFGNHPQADAYQGVICEATPYSAGVRAVVRITSGVIDGQEWPLSGKVLAYLRSMYPDSVMYGDTIIFRNPPHPIPAVRNAFEWDPATHYGKNGITHRVFLAPDAYAVKALRGYHLKRYSATVRSYFEVRIDSLIPDRQVSAVLKAMLLGDKSSVSSELREAYAQAGTIHILAISGLHIGIIATILYFVIGRPRPERGVMRASLRTAAILAGIWSFTIVSGMSPSAVRASLMFTVFILGLVAKRAATALNILGCSAIMTLIVDPLQLHSLSFQFSYCALLGILIFFKPIFRAFAIRSKLLRYAWGIVAVSIAAQLLLIPAMLFYFNRISLLSPLTSLFAIPGAFILVAGGLGTLALSHVLPGFISVLSYPLSKIGGVMNHLIVMASEQPFSTIDNVHLDTWQLSLSYMVLIATGMRILTQRRYWWAVAMVPVTGLMIYNVVHLTQMASSPTLTIYRAPGIALEIFDKNQSFATFQLHTQPPFLQHTIRKNRLAHQVRTDSVIQRPTQTVLSGLEVGNIRMTVWPPVPSQNKMADENPGLLVFVTDDVPPPTFAQWKSRGCRWVIISGVLSFYQRRRMTRQAEKLGLKVHDLAEHGAFHIKLKHLQS